MKKGIEHEPLIWKILNEIRESSRFKNSKQFIQHGKTSVYMHSVSVAYMSCYIAEKYNLSVDYYSLITGALYMIIFSMTGMIRRMGTKDLTAFIIRRRHLQMPKGTLK